MDRRRFLSALPAAGLALQSASSAFAQAKTKGVMLMNRIGPSTSDLYIAAGDGSGERKLFGESTFDLNGSFSADGRWVVFTSERNGDGQADIFRTRLDGTGVEPLVTGPSMDDCGVLSPDGATLAFVSTRDGYRTNIWTLDLRTRALRNLTGGKEQQGDPAGPDGFFRPAWSPDGQWIAFSSDRNTPWRGHDEGKGWEHTQELSIYVIRPDGTGLRKVASKPGFCLGSPKWSPDGRRVVFYEITTEGTWGARRPEWIGRIGSQIVSVDVATGQRMEHTTGPALKVAPQFLGNGEVGYLIKNGAEAGLAFASGRAPIRRAIRAPAWSSDGKWMVYQKVGFKARAQGNPLYSWDGDWDYRFSDVFSNIARDGTLAFTEKQNGNSSIVIENADGSGRRVLYNPADHGFPPDMLAKGLAGAFAPSWSPDGQWVTFGVGYWFQERATHKATIMRVRRDGTGLEPLTDGNDHSGFPSFSADGKSIVFRIWGETVKGLRILDLATKKVRVLTTEDDNLPGWSPDGRRIVFTRRTSVTNFDIFTIQPDGKGLRRLTDNGANDAHAVWAVDGRIMWSSGMYGFREEAALYDNNFQPYGQVFVMNADGSGKKILTDSLWEDSLSAYMPARR
jgi:Tol biopolymer transport system component